MIGILVAAAMAAQAAPAPAPAAKGEVVRAEAAIRCSLDNRGALIDCEVLSETPPGRGVGGAAAASLRNRRLGEGARSKADAENKVTVPVRFRLSREEAEGMGIAPPGTPPPILKPLWRKRPTGPDMVKYYPAMGRDLGLDGSGFVACRAGSSGRLEGCQAVNVFPRDKGFERAMVTLAERTFQLEPKDGDGQPVAGRLLMMPITWQMW